MSFLPDNIRNNKILEENIYSSSFKDNKHSSMIDYFWEKDYFEEEFNILMNLSEIPKKRFESFLANPFLTQEMLEKI